MYSSSLCELPSPYHDTSWSPVLKRKSDRMLQSHVWNLFLISCWFWVPFDGINADVARKFCFAACLWAVLLHLHSWGFTIGPREFLFVLGSLSESHCATNCCLASVFCHMIAHKLKSWTFVQIICGSLTPLSFVLGLHWNSSLSLTMDVLSWTQMSLNDSLHVDWDRTKAGCAQLSKSAVHVDCSLLSTGLRLIKSHQKTALPILYSS